MRFAIIVLLCFILGASPTAAQADEPSITGVNAWIIALMECEECSQRDVQAVAKLGSLALPLLAETLREPSRDRQEAARQHLVAVYRALKEHEITHPKAVVPMSEDKYVNTYLGKYIARYQTRSAQVIAEIGGIEAKLLLDAALQLPLRDDVLKAIGASLDKVNASLSSGP